MLDILRQEFKNRRIAQGLTLAQVAESAGVSAVALYKFENGHMKFRTENYRRVADALGIKLKIVDTSLEISILN